MLIEHGMNGAPIFSDGRMLALYVEDGCSRSPGMLPVPAWAVIVAHSFTLAAQAASLAGTGMPGCALCTGIYICVCVCVRDLYLAGESAQQFFRWFPGHHYAVQHSAALLQAGLTPSEWPGNQRHLANEVITNACSH